MCLLLSSLNHKMIIIQTFLSSVQNVQNVRKKFGPKLVVVVSDKTKKKKQSLLLKSDATVSKPL